MPFNQVDIMKTKNIVLLSLLFVFYFFCYTQEYWESIYSSNSSIHCLEINSNGDLFAGTQNGIYRSIDDGVSWISVLDSLAVGSIEINSEGDIYSSPRPVYFSLDNGDEWETLNYPELGVTHMFIDSENNLLVGFYGGIYKTDNNGSNWELVLSLPYMVESVNSIIENSEGVLFAGTTNFIGGGGVYRSLDNGANWEYISLEYYYISSLALNSSDELFACSRGHHYEGNGGVFRSSDNGETWIELIENILVTSIAIDSEDRIFIGCSSLDGATGAVQVSDDSGENWQLIESELMPSIIGIEFITISEDDFIYAISYESISHIYRSLLPTTKIANNQLHSMNFGLKNYPNPFNPTTTITFQTTNLHKDARIDIYNIKGQHIREFKIDNLQYKNNSVVWDGADSSGKEVSSGIYLYKLTSGAQMQIKKAVMVK